MYEKTMVLFLFLPVTVFTMDLAPTEDQAFFLLVNNNGEVKVSNQHQLCGSRYIQACSNFNDASDKKIINLPPMLADIPVQGLSDAINLYEDVTNENFDFVHNKLPKNNLKNSWTAVQLAYHLFDEDNVSRATQYFFQQAKDNWVTYFYPRKDKPQFKPLITALKRTLFNRTTSLAMNNQTVSTRSLYDTVSSSSDGTRFAINDNSSDCTIYDNTGKIVETISLEDYYGQDDVSFKHKKIFFKDDGSLSIFVYLYSNERLKSLAQVLEYKNGSISMQKAITLQAESSFIPISFSNNTFVYSKDASSIEIMKQENGSLTSYEYGDLCLPVELSFCGSDIIITNSRCLLEILEPTGGSRYSIDVKSKVFDVISDAYLVIADDKLGGIRFFERDLKDRKLYEISQYKITDRSEKIRSMSISPDGATCALLTIYYGAVHGSPFMDVPQLTLKLIDIRDMYSLEILQMEVLSIGRSRKYFVKFLDDETLLTSFNKKISIYNIKSEYSEINPEDPSVMQLLEQLYC